MKWQQRGRRRAWLRRVRCVSRWCRDAYAACKVVLSVLCWEMLTGAPLSWPQRFTGAYRDLIEHTCCLTATNVDE